jgi:hypothetical protein
MTKRPTVAAVRGDDNAAVLTERMRISAIIESPEGKRNPAMANKLALYSSLDVETAKSILGTAAPATPYLAAMDREGPIGLSASTTDFNSDSKVARLKEIETNVGAFNAAMRGEKPKAK